MEQRVEDLAQKLVRVRQQRETNIRIKMNRQMSQQSTTQETFFQRKIEQSEKEARDKEKYIQEMEKKEAEILEKIKVTQNIQLEEFNKLEEAMFEQ